jgi:hypothetical protein
LSHFAGKSRDSKKVTYNGDFVENNHTFRGRVPWDGGLDGRKNHYEKNNMAGILAYRRTGGSAGRYGSARLAA